MSDSMESQKSTKFDQFVEAFDTDQKVILTAAALTSWGYLGIGMWAHSAGYVGEDALRITAGIMMIPFAMVLFGIAYIGFKGVYEIDDADLRGWP